tara:strand:- start:330 stop:752 length:423 start_codon:yes stop_codon:yes gene_type:complete
MLTVLFFLTSCGQPLQLHGTSVDPEKIKIIVIGSTKKAEITALLGSPSIKQSYGKESWFYMNSMAKRSVFSGDKLISRTIVKITFNKQGIVESIDNFSKDDGKNISHSTRKTSTAGQKITVLQQLLGNFGRFNDRAARNF